MATRKHKATKARKAAAAARGRGKRRPGKKGKGKSFPGVPGRKGKLLAQEQAVQEQTVPQNIQWMNATQVNPLGQAGVTFDENGNPVHTTTLSDPNQQILQSGQGLTQMGQNLAQQGLQGYNQFNFGNFDEQRGRIEDAAFGRLTRGLEEDYQQSRGAKEQELYNKGIPYSDDPQSRYQRELGGIDERFDEARLQARSQASVLGGQELQRQYGIDLGVHQQGLSDIGTLQQQGTGLMMPNFQQYQGQTAQYTSPAELSLALGNLKQGNKALGIEQQKVGIAAQQANRPPAVQPAPSPFVTG